MNEDKGLKRKIGGWGLIAICIFGAAIMGIAGCREQVSYDIQAEIDKVGITFVPDQREGVWKITPVNAGSNKYILTGETTSNDAKSALIVTLSKNDIQLTDSILILPDTINNSKYMGLVTVSVANLRKEAKHSAELVSQTILGTPLLILKQKNSWLLVQTPDKYIAWTERASVVLKDRSEFEKWRKAEKVIYQKNSGWVYNSDDEFQVVGDLVSGAILEKKDVVGNHVSVIFPDGREGVVKKTETVDYMVWYNQSMASGDNLVITAYTFMGLPYLWGGTSSKAVDCSGFIQSVFFRNGLILSRDASLQAEHGEFIDISKGYSGLERGDLLFFGSRDEKGDRVTHVALYIGDNEYINASSRVMINSLDSTKTNFSGYRKNSLLSVRRIISNIDGKGIVQVSKTKLY